MVRGERSGLYGVLVGTPEGRRPLGRPKRRWGDSITYIIILDFFNMIGRAGTWRGNLTAQTFRNFFGHKLGR